MSRHRSSNSAASGRSGLDDAETWIFDLDNTLYSASERLSAQTNRLLGTFVSEFLGVDLEEARRIQKAYFREYGLTLRGLMVNHGLDPSVYSAHMMQADLSDIEPDPALADAIARLEGRKVVYTNAFTRHAEEVLARLGMDGHFEAVHDIEAADYVAKPAADAYRELCRRHGIDARRAVMIDDIARNLEPAADLGMTTVWFQTGAEWARGVDRADYIHHVTDDIAAWIGELLGPGERDAAPAAGSTGC